MSSSVRDNQSKDRHGISARHGGAARRRGKHRTGARASGERCRED